MCITYRIGKEGGGVIEPAKKNSDPGQRVQSRHPLGFVWTGRLLANPNPEFKLILQSWFRVRVYEDSVLPASLPPKNGGTSIVLMRALFGLVIRSDFRHISPHSESMAVASFWEAHLSYSCLRLPTPLQTSSIVVLLFPFPFVPNPCWPLKDFFSRNAASPSLNPANVICKVRGIMNVDTNLACFTDRLASSAVPCPRPLSTPSLRLLSPSSSSPPL